MIFTRVFRKFSTLVLAEHTNNTISKNTMKMLSGAKKFNDETHLLLLGDNVDHVVSSAKQTIPAQYVQKYVCAPLPHLVADSVQAIVEGLINKYKYARVMGLSSSYGKDVIPRLGGKYGVQPISDIIEIVDNATFVRPTYAGNALTKVHSTEEINFLTVRASSFEEPQPGTNEAEVENVPSQQGATSFVREDKNDSNRPELTTARVVVSGGRGVKSKENFDIINGLAEAFGDAAVGASRAAVDSGYCPNEMQVGQTGKVVAPQLYIAVGISGAVQHLAGMKDSKYIVAINTRPDEPIFEIADYGLEADLFKAVPELTQKIKKIKSA